MSRHVLRRLARLEGRLRRESCEAFLRAVRRSLKAGGRFALQTGLLAEVIYAQQPMRRWFPFGDLFFLHETSSDPFTGTQTSSYVLIQDGRVERKQAVYQLYTLRELLRLLDAVGFTEVEVFGSPQREPFRVGSPGAWLVMRRG